MTTHNIVIYHCIRCGAVVDRDPRDPPPQCCGAEMAVAAADTVPGEGQPSAPPDAGSGSAETDRKLPPR